MALSWQGRRIQLLKGRKVKELLTFNIHRAAKWQDITLKKLLYRAQNTAYGKQYGFGEILISENVMQSYAEQVPIVDYSVMHPYWIEAFKGKEDVTWPGRIMHFALSSGTSDGASKYIPVSEVQLKSIIRASRRQMLAVATSDIPKDFLTKDYLMVGGSTTLQFDGTSYCGDLSGITTLNVPNWFDRYSQPPPEIRALSNWHDKIEAMVNQAPEWDVVMIAGVPAWIKILIEKILERYSLKSIHEIWPNFSVYLWGGVALTPYRNALDKMFTNEVRYYETYLASEGFVAFQTKTDSQGMRLIFRNNVFYEFVPFTSENFDANGSILQGAKTVSLLDVEENKDYAILLSTGAGAWRYLIGDTIKFVNKENCEIKITGRTKHFLSICGEHLSVDNMTQALQLCAHELDVAITEFTVKGLRWPDNSLGHKWYIACTNTQLDKSQFQLLLDKKLCELNDDYCVERKHALKNIEIILLPESVFLEWMERHKKTGSQNKFPRVLSDSLYDDWVCHVAQYQSNNL